MKIRSLKTGKYALHSALGPIIEVVEGEIIDFDLNEGQIILFAEYGVIDIDDIDDIYEEEEVEEEESESETVIELKKLIENLEDETEIKAVLQDYGAINFDKKVSKKNSIENMIIALDKLSEKEE